MVHAPGLSRYDHAAMNRETLSKWIPRVVGSMLLVFVAATAWAMTVQGIFEPAKLDVDYFYVGAGNNLLLVRLFLALGVSALSILWVFRPGSIAARLARLALIPAVLLTFEWSVISLDRYAPDFSEEHFVEILKAQRNGKVLMRAEVTARLGKPLMTASRPDGSVRWSYTFTPSGGFGWPKRVLTFDSRGALVDALHLDEP